MSLQTTLKGDRIQIALFGKRNAGKSSVINAITNQNIAIVSDVKGTTTDPVSKAMEILPLGPCMLIDTPGLDDVGELGTLRVEKAMQVLNRTDIVLLILDITESAQNGQKGDTTSPEKSEDPRLATSNPEAGYNIGLPEKEQEILKLAKEKNLPCIIVLNQADRIDPGQAETIKTALSEKHPGISINIVSALEKTGFEELKASMVAQLPEQKRELQIVGDLIKPKDILVLVVPVDSAAPKGRLIMPQQQVIRDILDNHAISIVAQVEELADILNRLQGQIRMVITDSQAFKEVSAIVPEYIPLTSFSILFARHKGNLKKLVEGVRKVESLQDGDKVLIAEGCTHHRQCEDIGTVKIPAWLKNHSGKQLEIETCSGTEFPTDLTPYSLVIHCGGCTLHEKEMKHRMSLGAGQGVPIVNYGIFIAYVNGILARSLEVFPDIN